MSSSGSCMIEHGKRSPKKAYIVLIGMTGAGKSSTLNVFLGQKNDEVNGKNIARSFASATQTVLEYSVVVHTPDDKVRNELIIIDTPGFGDTLGGIDKDAMILATLEKHLADHEELADCFPTAVFLTINIADSQILEDNSNLIGLLKALETFIDNRTLIDVGHDKCNVVIVLTHFYDLKEEDKSLLEHPEPKEILIRGLLNAYSTIPQNVKIVMAENCADKFGFAKANDYFKLPNGDLYPLNLFEVVEKLAFMSGDTIGQKIISHAFASPYQLEKRLVRETHLLPPEDQSCMEYYRRIESDKFNITETEVGTALQNYWDSIPKEKTTLLASSINIVKKKFLEQSIIRHKDIPENVHDTLKLLRVLPMNPAVEELVTKLGIRPPSLKMTLNGVGCFYNICNDYVSSFCPFSTEKEYITGVGFYVPKCFKVAKLLAKDSVFVNGFIFESNNKYFEHRLDMFKLRYDKKLLGTFSGNVIPGCNVGPEKSIERLSAMLEWRIYSVSLADHPKLKQDYVSMLKIESQEKNALEEHLAKIVLTQGSHVVNSALLGGSVVLTATLLPNMKSKTKIEDVMSKMKAWLEQLNDNTLKDLKDFQEWQFEIEFFGGDPSFIKPALNRIGSSSFSNFYDKWKKSLEIHPVYLRTNISLCHISDYLQFEDFDLSKRVSESTHKTLGIVSNAHGTRSRSEIPKSFLQSWCSVM